MRESEKRELKHGSFEKSSVVEWDLPAVVAEVEEAVVILAMAKRTTLRGKVAAVVME